MLVLRFLHTFKIQSYITKKNSRLLTENHASYDIFIGVVSEFTSAEINNRV